jgi:Mrp family chromosome partitioning ATPase/capsular polysaccharide biosynthesis protein
MSNTERILRRYRLLLALSVIIGAAAAFAVSSIAKPVYEATASLQFTQLTELEGLAGVANGTLQTPAEQAAASSGYPTLNAVVAAAKRGLGSDKTIDALRNQVSATVDTTSNLVDVTATGHDARFAYRLANAIAAATVNYTNAGVQQVFAIDAAQLERHIRTLPKRITDITTVEQEQADLARLQALAIEAHPASISQAAQVPTSPSSPKPAFDTILGAVLGLLLGGFVVFVRERLDVTLRTPEQLEELIGFPVIIEVEDGVLGTTPLAGEESQALTREQQSVAARFGLLRRSVELLGERDSPPRVVAVTSAGAEEGKSTVALSLACAFAGVGRRTALLECDLRRPSLAARLGLGLGPGLVDHILNACSPEDVVHAVPVLSRMAVNGRERDHHVLACIFAGSDAADPEEVLASSAFRTVLDELAAAYDVVVIDTPPVLPVADTQEIIPLVDALVLCARAHRSRAAELRAFQAALARLPKRPAVAVTTGWSRLDMELTAKYYGYEGYYGRTRDVASSRG